MSRYRRLFGRMFMNWLATLRIATASVLLAWSGLALSAADVVMTPSQLWTLRTADASVAGMAITLTTVSIANPASCSSASSAQLLETEHPAFHLLFAIAAAGAPTNPGGFKLTIDGNSCSGIFPKIKNLTYLPFYVYDP